MQQRHRQAKKLAALAGLLSALEDQVRGAGFFGPPSSVSPAAHEGPGVSGRYDGESAAVVIARRANSRGLRPLRAR